MCSDWTELYRPITLDEIQGNPKAVRELREWGRSWESGKPVKKAVVLMGPPGTGKTSAALALANEFGWGVVEMNASDQRNAEAIKNIALRGAIAETFTDEGDFLSSHKNQRKLIILDEADNIFGREDRGGIHAIGELIRQTRQPVVLIVNDFYELSRRSTVIKTHCKQIKFNKIRTPTVVKILGEIARAEGIKISRRALEMIAENAAGDLRAAIRDLQSLAIGKKEISEKDTLLLQNRYVSRTVMDLMETIFMDHDPYKARSRAWNVDEPPDHILLWVEENLPYQYKNPAELMRGMEILSRADIFLGRVSKKQYFGFWSYAMDLMTFGVATAGEKTRRGYTRFRFPGYLLKMSGTRSVRGVKSAVSRKVGELCHTSERRVVEEILPYIKVLFRNDRDFKVALSLELDLEPEEMAYLLDEKEDSNAVKHLLSEVERVKKARFTKKTPLPINGMGESVQENMEDTAQPEPAEPVLQKKIFEY